MAKLKKSFYFRFSLTEPYKNLTSSYAVDAIDKLVPLINLEEISPTFEEEKDELEETKSEKGTNFD